MPETNTPGNFTAAVGGLIAMAMSLTVACTGTDTGNPFQQEIRVGAHSSDPNDFAVAIADGGGVVTGAWLIVGSMRLVVDGNCDGSGEGFDMNPLGATDHAQGRETLSVAMEDGDFCQLTVPVDGAGTLPAGAPPELGNGNGVVVLGTTAAGTDFTIIGAARDVAMPGSDPFFLSEDEGALFLGFDVSVWLAGLDIDAGVQTSGRVIISDSSNATLSAAFDANFARGLELYRDLDADGEADAGEDRLAVGQ